MRPSVAGSSGPRRLIGERNGLESKRRSVGRRRRPLGGRPFVPTAPKYRRDGAPDTGTDTALGAGRSRHRARNDPASGGDPGDLAGHRFLSRAARRAGCRASVRALRQNDDAWSELLVSGADRRGADAERRTNEPDHHRLSRRRSARRRTARRAAGKSDADRGSKHHRCRLHRSMADQERGRLPVQHPRPGGHRQSRGRERHSRDHGQDPAGGCA